MRRRDFLYNTVPAFLAPTVMDGYAFSSVQNNPMLDRLLQLSGDSDNVLVLIQLNGGNDGLNMVIPKSNYSGYLNARSNIAIPENKILALNGYAATGLHPAMTGLQSLFNDGKLSIIQSVGYPSPNFSHFRATDIWMSGSDSNQVVNSGWAGRYLSDLNPNFPIGYPNSSMPDPLAIQIGSVSSLITQGPSVGLGLSITNPTSFYNLVGGIQEPAPATPAGKELSYIRNIAQQTQQYATVIKAAAAKVTQQSTYPTNNSLADQLKIVARLIKGGLKTKIYLVNLGGFDTHAQQVVVVDQTTGNHANLLKTVSEGIKSFMDDCSFLGIDQRVMGLTFSEFGRRIKSNSSNGTDHGAAAPVFVFGGKVQSGVLGNNPTIATNVTANDNIPHQYDFRSVYASILQDWFCANPTTLQNTMLKNFQTLPLVQNGVCSTSINTINQMSADTLISNYPNPFVNSTVIRYKSAGGHTLVQIMDTTGRVIANLTDKEVAVGTYSITFDSKNLPAGVYYMRLQNGAIQQVKSILKVRP